MIRAIASPGPTTLKAQAILADTSRERFKDTESSDALLTAVIDFFPEWAGTVYVIVPDGGEEVAKIGVTRGSAPQRLSNLGTGYWRDLRLFAAVSIWNGRLAVIERIAHQVAGGRSKRLKGEWFEMSGDGALDCILEVAHRANAEALSCTQTWWRGVLQDERPVAPTHSDNERRAAMRVKLGID